MQLSENLIPVAFKRIPWNKGKLTGAKPPLRPKHVWSIRTKLQMADRKRDLALFNLAIDSRAAATGRSPLLALSGHAGQRVPRQLSGVKQPCLLLGRAAANDPKRTCPCTEGSYTASSFSVYCSLINRMDSIHRTDHAVGGAVPPW